MIRIKLFVALFFLVALAQGQNKYSIDAIVKDSTGQVLIGANVWIIKGPDSFHTITDQNGHFTFPQISTPIFNIRITLLGYETYNNKYNYPLINNHIQLPDILLNIKTNILKEVTVRSQISPITLKEDTIEYNISKFHLRDNALLDELLRRLPGIEIDQNGSLKFMGQPISKIKINGKDFMINNIKDLIRVIPLETLDRVQILDDYGKLAEITGRTQGIAAGKVINLETKNTLNTTQNLKAQLGVGTSNRIQSNFNASSIGNKKQIILYGTTDNTIPGQGEIVSSRGAFLFRNQINDLFYTNGGIFADHESNKLQSYNTTQNLTSEGILSINSNSTTTSTYNNYSLAETIEYKDKKRNKISLQLSGERKKQTDQNNTISSQTGLQHIEQSYSNITHATIPNLRTSLYGIHQFNNPGELLAFSATYNYSGNTSYQNIINASTYYNSDDTAIKDSLQYQLLNKQNNAYNITFQSSYIKPLSTTASFEILYNLKSNNNSFEQETQWADKEGKMKIIDSLSNQFDYRITEHKSGINFNNKKGKIEYTIGVYYHFAKYNSNQSQWLVPNLNIKYQLNKTSRLSLHYEGHPNYPDNQQLRPITDRTNPLFPIIGNPDLKAGLYNIFLLEYSLVKKSILFINIRYTPITNQTVTNSILIKDTLNTVTQETHYLNTNGLYLLSGNYSWSHPFDEGKYQLFFEGNANLNNNIYYLQNLRNSSQNLMLTQSIRLGIYQKWIELNTSTGYTHNQTTYSLSQTPTSQIGTWNLAFNSKFFAGPSWSFWLDLNKQFNSGYANGVSANPTDLAATIEKTFLKKALSCRLQGFNLLNQNIGIAQTISGNTTTQTRTNQLGRYILLSLILDLKKTKK
ncbi:outer membrane beta-barrel protein [Chitinophaga sp. LS1]|uniref:outer membrane beta-barrel protein n=1 Tax=Chitinophaga sp. LS1 TaxID=3051176 RepID=UPI002AAB0E40|nr:outer membrane beta-barrel protein [Chitinophaga sp. LS1]WPV67853.1 outer membrane beta-barrel protein [Chitinophaga sp. LS1]